MKKSQFRASLLAASALSVSIASQIHAAAFTSSATGGVWEDPASWVGGGFPDTFALDSATITGGVGIIYDDFANPLNGGGVSTPATPFTIALALNPGGLSVANNNKININGGSSLTQANLLNEIRIGEGAGATSGLGEMNIDGGGLFLSGSSLGVAVGSDIDSNAGNGTGNGTVNLKNGLFIMETGGVPGSVASLGVGIEGATGVFNVGDGAGPADEAILDLKSNNNALGAGVTNQLPGSTLAGTGTVNVKSDGKLNFGTGSLTFGDTSTGSGTLNVNGGTVGEGAGSTGAIRIGNGGASGNVTITAGVINSGGDLTLGLGTGSVAVGTFSGGTTLAKHLSFGDGGTATVSLSGATTQLNSTLNLNVGTNGGVGHINQTGGAVTYSEWSAIGVSAGAAGSNWDISGGSITSAAGFEVGSDRDGTFNVSGTAVVSVGPLEAGIRSGSNGHINITSGSVTTTRLGIAGAQGGGASGDVNISGTADVRITGGGGQSYIGNNAGSLGTVNVTGVTVNNVSGQDWQIGFNGGTGNLNIVNGVVKHNWWFNIARGGASTGNVTVDGPTSKIILDGNPGPGGGGDIHWNVGEDGTGTMTVKNGATVDHNNAQSYRSHVGRNNGSNGTLNVNTGGRVDVTELFAGTNGGATGKIDIESGGIVTVQNWLEVGSRGGNGTINVNGAGSQLIHKSDLYGRNGGNGGDTQVGYEGGNGTINVTGGGTFQTGWWLNIARGGGSVGLVNVDGAGSKVAIGNTVGLGGPDARLNVGENGTGTLNITNGGLVEGNTETAVGQNGGSVGLLDVSSGGTFTTGNWLIIGNAGGSNGTVNLNGASSSINLTGMSDAGGNLGERSRLMIGRSGTGTLNQTAGTITFGGWSAIGLDRGSEGTYNMSGGLLQTRPEFDFDWYVGRQNSDSGNPALSAHGTLNVSGTANFNMLTDAANGDPGARNGMRLNVGAGHDFGTNDAQGTVNITGGTLSVLSFTVGDNGQATVTQNGGTVNVGQWMEIGQGNAADTVNNVASYTLNAGVINTQQIVAGTRRAGLLTVNGGIINLGTDGTTANPGWGDFAVGRDGGGADHGNGHLVMTGGTINATGKNFQIARGGPNTQGVVDQSGGAIFTNQVTIGDNGATNAVINMSGGSLTNNDTYTVGNGGGTIGKLNVSNTANLNANVMQVGRNGGRGEVRQTGGVVSAGGGWA